MFVFLCAVVVVIFLMHKFLSREYGYFEAKGIPYSTPIFIVGSRKDFILRNKSILTVMKDFYDEFRDDKYKPYKKFDEIFVHTFEKRAENVKRKRRAERVKNFGDPSV